MDQVTALIVDGLVSDFGGLHGAVTRQRGAPVVGDRVEHPAPFASPAGEIVRHPGAERGAIAIAARHADLAGIFGEQVAAAGAIMRAVSEEGVDPLHHRVILMARHFGREAEVRQIEHAPVKRAPGGEQVAAPFGGEADDRVRAEQALGQLVAQLDIVPPALAVAEVVHHLHPGHAARLELFELGVGPFGLVKVGRVDCLAAERGAVAHRGGAVLGDQLAVLIAVEVVAALETGGAERRILDDIVKRNALIGDPVAAIDLHILKPPLVAGEEQVRIGDLADAGPGRAVAVVHDDREALRRDQPAEAAFQRIMAVIMQQVGIVHGMHPAADIGVGDRLAQRRTVNRLAEVLVDVRAIESGRCGGVAGHGLRFLSRRCTAVGAIR